MFYYQKCVRGNLLGKSLLLGILIKFLFAGIVPANKFLFAGTVPANKFLFAGIVQANKFLYAGIVPPNNLFLLT